MPSPILHSLIADLLRSMEQEGMTLGTGQHLRVQELWKRLPEKIEPERLKTLLVPLFATNPQEQDRFYALFDKSWKRVQEASKVEEVRPAEVSQEEKAEKNWRRLLIGAIALIAIILAAIFWKADVEITLVNQFYEIPLSITRADTLVQDPILRKGEKDTLKQLAFLDGELYAVDSIWGEYEIDSLDQLIIRAGDTVGRKVDTLVVRAFYNTGLDSIHFILNLLEVRQPQMAEAEKPEKKAPRLKTKEIPYKHDLPAPDPVALQRAEFWQNNRWWIKSSLIVLLALLFWTLVQWLERRRKKTIAHLQKAHQAPPYVWTIDLDEPEELAVGIQAKQLTSRLRRRRLEDYHRIDIPATVKATARSAGQVHLQYRQPSKPSEYLLLIDRNAMQDHRALLFDSLYESFKQEEVHIDRFFYDGSPQVVFNEKYPGGLSLKELQHQHSESRLLIVGDGQAFFNPLTGEWAGWTEELNKWKARGLLTTKPLDKWSLDEEWLARRFFLLPASLQGIDRLIEQFELDEPKPWEELVKQIDDISVESILFREDLLTTLRQHYPEPMIRWIAACAVYPQLQWKMTLHLGKELSTPENNLLTIENILSLVRLPWFVQGKMPEPVRTVLIDYLQKEGLEQKVRQTIKVLLDKAPKPARDAVAYEKWRVNQLFNELQITAATPKRKAIKQELQDHLEAGYQPDQVTLDLLENETTPTAAARLSDRWKEWLFREGESVFGWRGWTWAAPAWLICSGIILAINPDFESCKGELLPFDDQMACIETDEDRVVYSDLMSRKIIRENKYLMGNAGYPSPQDSAESPSPLSWIISIKDETFGIEDQFSIYEQTSPAGQGQAQEPYEETSPFLEYNTTASDIFDFYQPYLPSNLVDPKELREVMIFPLQDSLEAFNQRAEDERPRLLGDQYVENLAAALFNKGVTFFNNYLDMKEGFASDTSANAETLLDQSAFNLLLARDLKTGQPEIFSALLRVYGQDPSLNFPTAISGQVGTTENNGAPLADVQVSLEGMNVDVLTDDSGRYSFDLPADWDNNILNLNFFKPGYHVEKLTHIIVDRTSDEVRTVDMEPIPQDLEDRLRVFRDQETRRQGVRTTDGKVIIPANYAEVVKDKETGYYRVETPATRAGSNYGYYDQSGKIIIPAIFSYLDFYSDGMVLAQDDDGFYGYFNVSGNKAFPFNFYEAWPFSSGRARVAIQNRFNEDTIQFYIGKDGKCIAGEFCPYSTIVNNYIRAICDIENREQYIARILDNGSPAEIMQVVSTDFLRIFYPPEIQEEANNCISNRELYVNGYLVLLTLYAAIADQIPSGAREAVVNFIRQLEGEPETMTRINQKLQGGSVSDMIAQIRKGFDLDTGAGAAASDLNPLRDLDNYKPGEVILSYYFDQNLPYGKTDDFACESAAQSYQSKLSAQGAPIPEGLPAQVSRLKDLAGKIYSSLGNNYGATIEIKSYADSDEGPNQTLLQMRADAIRNYLIEYNDGMLRPYVNSSDVVVIDTNINEGAPRPNTNQTAPNPYSETAIERRRVDVVFKKQTQHQQIQRPRQGGN